MALYTDLFHSESKNDPEDPSPALAFPRTQSSLDWLPVLAPMLTQQRFTSEAQLSQEHDSTITSIISFTLEKTGGNGEN